MKVICQGSELSDALSKVTKALPIKRSNPILDGVKITAEGDTLTLFATDLELAIEKKINAEVLIEGQYVVPGKLLSDYAKMISTEQVELDSTNEKMMVLRYGDSEVRMNGFSSDEYPVIKDVATDKSFIILKKALRDLINKIIFNVATDDARPALKGCCLNIKEEEVEGVASDGYRLALVKKPIKNNGIIDKIVVPAKSMMELSRLIDDDEESMTVYVDKNYIMVDLFHTKIVTRLIGENYISYGQLIQTVFNTEVTLDKKMFETALDRAALINRSSKKNCVTFDIKEDCMTLKANTEEGSIDERIPIKIKGKDLVAGFNNKYVMDCMKAIDDEYITFNFMSSTAPMIIKGADETWLYLVLPLRVII